MNLWKEWHRYICHVCWFLHRWISLIPDLLAYFPTGSLHLQNPSWSIWGIKRFRKRLLRGLQKYLMVWSGGRILGWEEWEDGSPEIEIPPSNIHIPKHQRLKTSISKNTPSPPNQPTNLLTKVVSNGRFLCCPSHKSVLGIEFQGLKGGGSPPNGTIPWSWVLHFPF